MERIEHLERATKRWRLIGVSAMGALVVVLIITGYVFSQREGRDPVPPQAGPGGDFPIDPAPAPVVYTNFCRVSVTPEELILDLCLNEQVTPDPKRPIRVSNRVVMNFFTVKRLANALHQVVQQHEAAYGPIELDFQKRVKRLPGGQ
jgi:hypothetical protein